MCTVVVLMRPAHVWPVLLAANRDEMLSRPWRPPAGNWPDRPGIVGGLDELAGGSWLGINQDGVVAGVLNRHGSLGPEEGRRSRGELVLEALDHADAAAAAEALHHLDPRAYRSFNLVVADNTRAFWLRHRGDEGPGRVERFPLPPGYSMITAYDRNDRASARIRDNLPRFEAAPVPQPERGDWSAWERLLARRGEAGEENEHESAMCVVTGRGFGTSSSSLIALPSRERPELKPRWLFAAGRPGESPYLPVAL